MLKDSRDFLSVMAALSRISTNLTPDILNVNYVINDLRGDMDTLSSFFADLKDRYGEFPWHDHKVKSASTSDTSTRVLVERISVGSCPTVGLYTTCSAPICNCSGDIIVNKDNK